MKCKTDLQLHSHNHEYMFPLNDSLLRSVLGHIQIRFWLKSKRKDELIKYTHRASAICSSTNMLLKHEVIVVQAVRNFVWLRIV